MKHETDITNFMSKSDFQKIQQFAKNKETPFLVLRLSKIEAEYDRLRKLMPYAKIFFAMKACPLDEVIKLMIKKGSCFDIASIEELDQLLALGVTPDRISFGNTIKKESSIDYAYKKGIRLFATDAMSDVHKLARKAPGANVFFRIICEGGSADWPLSRKFGAHPDMIYYLAIEAKKLGLNPYGISFHVGSQQRDIGQWDSAIAQVKYLFDALAKKDIFLKMINMGGGFPASYIRPTHDLSVYAKEITRFLNEDFANGLPEIIIEPGRSIAADAGIIVSEIIMISKKTALAQTSWVYLDIGKFSGLIETIDESIKYPIFVEGTRSHTSTEVIVAGPTCDSADILYEKYKYQMPIDIKEGDRVYILTAGAYTKSYSSICFNGLPPLKHYVIE
jgi:ornithine decarboxylase